MIFTIGFSRAVQLVTWFSFNWKDETGTLEMLFFLSIISAVNSSVFAVASLLAVAICSSFSSARRTGKHLPPVPASVMPGCQPGCLQASPSRTPRRSVDKAVLLAAGIFISLPREPSRNGCFKGQSCSQAPRGWAVFLVHPLAGAGHCTAVLLTCTMPTARGRFGPEFAVSEVNSPC